MKYRLLLFALLIISQVTHAEVILHGTRVIFPSDNKEVTLKVSNEGKDPSLIQAWLDDGNPNSTPDEISLPFLITPPIARVDPEKSQTLRILALPNSQTLNQQHESLFWLNVLDIPPRPSTSSNENSSNLLQLAIRSRIKFIYRPASLRDNVSDAPKKLIWQQKDGQINIQNPTPFYITITSIFSSEQKVQDLIPKGILISPFSEQNIPTHIYFKTLKFITINDYGNHLEQTAYLK